MRRRSPVFVNSGADNVKCGCFRPYYLAVYYVKSLEKSLDRLIEIPRGTSVDSARIDARNHLPNLRFLQPFVTRLSLSFSLNKSAHVREKHSAFYSAALGGFNPSKLIPFSRSIAHSLCFVLHQLGYVQPALSLGVPAPVLAPDHLTANPTTPVPCRAPLFPPPPSPGRPLQPPPVEKLYSSRSTRNC